MSAAEVRAWAAENGYACAPRGKVPHDVQAAYDHAHGELPDAEPSEGDDAQTWSVQVCIPGADPDTLDSIPGHLLEALWGAYFEGHRVGAEEERGRTKAAIDALLDES